MRKGRLHTGILKNFSKLNVDAIATLRLGGEAMKNKGKYSPFGVETSLYRIQQHGPFTCLWTDLLNKEAKVSIKHIQLLLKNNMKVVRTIMNPTTEKTGLHRL